MSFDREILDALSQKHKEGKNEASKAVYVDSERSDDILFPHTFIFISMFLVKMDFF